MPSSKTFKVSGTTPSSNSSGILNTRRRYSATSRGPIVMLSLVSTFFFFGRYDPDQLKHLKADRLFKHCVVPPLMQHRFKVIDADPGGAHPVSMFLPAPPGKGRPAASSGPPGLPSRHRPRPPGTFIAKPLAQGPTRKSQYSEWNPPRRAGSLEEGGKETISYPVCPIAAPGQRPGPGAQGHGHPQRIPHHTIYLVPGVPIYPTRGKGTSEMRNQ